MTSLNSSEEVSTTTRRLEKPGCCRSHFSTSKPSFFGIFRSSSIKSGSGYSARFAYFPSPPRYATASSPSLTTKKGLVIFALSKARRMRRTSSSRSSASKITPWSGIGEIDSAQFPPTRHHMRHRILLNRFLPTLGSEYRILGIDLLEKSAHGKNALFTISGQQADRQARHLRGRLSGLRTFSIWGAHPRRLGRQWIADAAHSPATEPFLDQRLASSAFYGFSTLRSPISAT